MKRRDFIVSAGSAGILIPVFARAAAPPCPPPEVSVSGGTSASTACAAAGGTSTSHYTTNFPGTENPISEGGVWTHLGQSWATVQTTPGFAFGTQSGSGGFNDSYAHLSGFGPDHTVSAVIKKAANVSGVHEVELHLRWSDSANSAQGYECLIAHDGRYCQINRWVGPFGSYENVANAAAPPVPQTGDVYKATISGSLIIVYMNNAEIVRATDTNLKTGNPGMGFYRESVGSNTDFGFSSFTATSP